MSPVVGLVGRGHIESWGEDLVSCESVWCLLFKKYPVGWVTLGLRDFIRDWQGPTEIRQAIRQACRIGPVGCLSDQKKIANFDIFAKIKASQESRYQGESVHTFTLLQLPLKVYLWWMQEDPCIQRGQKWCIFTQFLTSSYTWVHLHPPEVDFEGDL